MPTIRPAAESDRRQVRAAIDHLRLARNLLAASHAPRAAAAARKALRSAEGAARHVEHRIRRAKP